MAYDPRRPHAERYLQEPAASSKKLLRRMERDALKLCRALGYDLNTVEFAVEKGIPYAIDFMNPAPDAGLESVGQANFEWIVNEVAELAIAKAKAAPQAPELRWTRFLGADAIPRKKAKRKHTAKKKAKAPLVKPRKQEPVSTASPVEK
jgi:hypothetical protein